MAGHPMCTYVSRMLVSTWMAKKTMDNMEIRRWNSWWAKPGQLRARVRLVVVNPSTMVSVSRTRATIPLALVMYQKIDELIRHQRATLPG